jgi:hypothetical protein
VDTNNQREVRRPPPSVEPWRPSWLGALLVVAGLLTPVASSALTHDSARSPPAAALAVALLSLGAYRLVWTRPAPFPAWQRVLMALVIGTLGYCLVWIMPSQLLGLLGGVLRT